MNVKIALSTLEIDRIAKLSFAILRDLRDVDNLQGLFDSKQNRYY